MFQTPILFIIFNRPDVTFRVFEMIRQIQPRFLFIAADGPRKEKENEQELCAQTRSIINRIDWDCELKTLFREENVGCGRGVSEAITWFFSHVEAGIILEDDCLPDLSFFSYCESLLELYRTDERVMHISGTNSQFGKKRNKYSYYFSKYPHIWGWATWKRAWDHFSLDIDQADAESTENEIFEHYDFSDTEIKYWRNHFNVVKSKGLDTWDIQWTYTCWANKGVTIVPNINLISNIGFAENATHTRAEHSQLANRPTQNLQKLIHPPEIIIDTAADDATFRQYNLLQHTLYNRIKNWARSILPQPLKSVLKSTIR